MFPKHFTKFQNIQVIEKNISYLKTFKDFPKL